MITDTERLDFIAECARFSRTGISFDWDGFYRLSTRNNIGPPKDDIRNAIDAAIMGKTME